MQKTFKENFISLYKDFFRIGKIKEEEKLDLVRGLALLLKSGTPLNEGFSIISSQAPPGPYKEFLSSVKKRVEQGNPIYVSFEENRNFDQVFVNFIKAGEESGTLNQNLISLAEWLEKRMSLKKEISSATLYPKMIIGFALILGAGLSIFVLPRVVQVLEGLNVDLPLLTKILLFFSDFMQNYGVLVVVGIIVIGLTLKMLMNFPWFKKIIDAAILRTPVIGPLFRDYQLAVVSQLSFALFKSGVSINHTLDIVSDSISNFYYRRSIIDVSNSVEKGGSLSESMSKSPLLFPPILINVVSVGEKAGTLDESFSYLADYFFDKVSTKAKVLPTVIEPVILILVGLFVAFIASAIILPVYQVTTGIN